MSYIYTLMCLVSQPQFLASLGLIVDIVGAVLLFLYGLPAKLDREGHDYIITEAINEDEKRKAAKFDRLGRAGLLLLVFGFLLQLIALWL